MKSEVYAKNLEHELLSEYEEVMLLQQARDGDPNAREKLILSNLRLVHSVVQRYVNAASGITPDDLMADGIIGLCKAIDKYDVSFGTRLSTYAFVVINSTVKRSQYLHSAIRLPEDVRTQVRQINRVKAALVREGVAITVESISAQTQITVKEVMRLMHLESDVMPVLSFEKRLYEGNEDAAVYKLSDVVPDPGSEAAYQKIEMSATLEFFLSRLNKEERFLVEACFGLAGNLSTKEIAAKLGVHPRYITQMLEEAMGKLRRLREAIQGSLEEIQLAIENPKAVMADGQMDLLPQREIRKPGKRRKPKSKKMDTPKTDDNLKQLPLFD